MATQNRSPALLKHGSDLSLAAVFLCTLLGMFAAVAIHMPRETALALKRLIGIVVQHIGW